MVFGSWKSTSKDKNLETRPYNSDQKKKIVTMYIIDFNQTHCDQLQYMQTVNRYFVPIKLTQRYVNYISISKTEKEAGRYFK